MGILADLEGEDEEGLEHYQDQFEGLNRVLAAHGLPAHNEPPQGESWGADMWGYGGLHYLRRAAAHLAIRGTLPPPGGKDAAHDPLIAEYGARAAGEPRGLRRLFGKGRPERLGFDHLMLHNDAEGYYLPMDFAQVLVADSLSALVGGEVGSSPRLLAECRRLQQALGIPPDLDPESDLLFEAADAQGEGDDWRRYGVEAFTCVRLLHAAGLSIARGAAIVFT